MRPSHRSPQSPQRPIFHHLRLCVKQPFPNILLQPFKEAPRTGAVSSSLPSIAPAETPSCGHPQATFPQSVTTAWLPRWGRRRGEKAPGGAALQPAQRQGDAGEEQRKMLNPSAIFTLAFSLSNKFPCPIISPLKEKEDLDTKAAVQISPMSSTLSPFPRGETRTLLASDRYTCRLAEGRAAPAVPRSRERSPGIGPQQPPPRLTTPAGRARTNFPVPGLRGQTDGRRATLVPGSGLKCRWDPSPCIQTWVQRGPTGRPGGACVRQGLAGVTEAPRRARSPGGRAAGGPGPAPLPAPQQLQLEEEGSEEEEEDEERGCVPQPEPLPSGLPPTSGR